MTKLCIGYGKKLGKCNNKLVAPGKSPYCKNCAGKSFEDEIADLFRVQGYDIQLNLTLSGTQNDFFAQLRYGVVKVGVLVECKWKSEGSSTVNSGDVRKFHSTWDLFNKQGIYGKAEKAFLVTNGEFAPEAVEVAKNLDVEVHTQADMVKNLMDFGPYLKGLVNDFRNSHLYGHYIDICSITGENLSEEVLTLLYEDDEQAVVVLGDYGCGKTSLCMKLCSDLANDILSGKEAPLPVLIQLREYTKAFDMEELITNMLVNKWRIPNGNFSTFMELVKHGRVILIFDGFDEIARRVDYSVKYKVFNEICKFATNNSKLLVTCRPNFFNQREEFERLFKSSPLYFEPNDRKVRFAEVESEELTKDQIKQYIVSYGDDLTTKGYRVPDFLDVLENTHDLWDLAKRPVLLNVLMDTIPELTPKKGTKINAAGLYDIYTRFWLDREDKKGKTLIKSSDKLLFTEQLAKEMFTKNELSINFTKLPLVVKDYFYEHISTPYDIDHFSHDIRSCSFLNSDDNGDYKFIHKSFMEFFAARKILTDLTQIPRMKKGREAQEVNTLLGTTLITLEMGLFIKDMIDIDMFNGDDLQLLLFTLQIEKLDNTAAKNMLSVVSKTGRDISLALGKVHDLRGADLSHAHIKKVTFRDASLESVSFFNTTLEEIAFEDCSLPNSIFRKSTLRGVSFDRSNIEAADFSHAHITDCSFNESGLAFANFHNAAVFDSDFDHAELTEIKINSASKMERCKNLHTTIGAPYTLNV